MQILQAHPCQAQPTHAHSRKAERYNFATKPSSHPHVSQASSAGRTSIPPSHQLGHISCDIMCFVIQMSVHVLGSCCLRCAAIPGVRQKWMDSSHPDGLPTAAQRCFARTSRRTVEPCLSFFLGCPPGTCFEVCCHLDPPSVGNQDVQRESRIPGSPTNLVKNLLP